MAAKPDIETRKAILRARGVPERFVNALATRRDMLPLFRLGVYALIAALFLFILALTTMMNRTEQVLTVIAAPLLFPDAKNSLIFYTSGYLSITVLYALMLVLVLVGMLLTIRGTRAASYPAFDRRASWLRRLHSGETFASIVPDPHYASLAHVNDDAAFIDSMRPKAKTSTLTLLVMIFVTLLSILSFGLSLISLMTYCSVNLDQVTWHRPGHAHRLPLQDVQYADVICYATNQRIKFDYRLVYHDQTISLWTWHDAMHGLGPSEVVDRLSAIDARFAVLHVPVHRMPQQGGPSDDGTACVDILAKRWKLSRPNALRQLVFGG